MVLITLTPMLNTRTVRTMVQMFLTMVMSWDLVTLAPTDLVTVSSTLVAVASLIIATASPANVSVSWNQKLHENFMRFWLLLQKRLFIFTIFLGAYHRWIFYKKAEILPWTTSIFANKILGKILTKTSILMQNCIEDDKVRRNLQNI